MTPEKAPGNEPPRRSRSRARTFPGGVPRRGNLHSLLTTGAGREIAATRRFRRSGATGFAGGETPTHYRRGVTFLSLLVVLMIVAVPVAGIIALALYLAGKRRDALRARAQAAAQVGWFPVPPNPWLAEVAAGLFQRGTAVGMVAGDFRGRGVCALDYQYTTTSSNGETTTTTTHECHVIALNLPAALPPLRVSRDTKLARMFIGRDLELESKAFNEAFRVGCADDRYAHAVLHPRMMEWMLANPGLQWQISGNALVSWGAGMWSVPDALARLEAMNRVIDLLPPFVLRDYGQPVY